MSLVITWLKPSAVFKLVAAIPFHIHLVIKVILWSIVFSAFYNSTFNSRRQQLRNKFMCGAARSRWKMISRCARSRKPEPRSFVAVVRANRVCVCLFCSLTRSFFRSAVAFWFEKNDTRSRKGEMNEWGWGCCGGSEMIFILTRQTD